MEGDFHPETVTLRDGTRVTLRAIQPEDAPRLQALHARLSPESVYLRFLDQRPALSAQDAQKFVAVDYRTRMAIVATLPLATGHLEAGSLTLPADDDEAIVGVARYAAADSDRPDTAEAAIVVEDAFQGRGLGTRLVDRLVRYARGHGIRCFLATVHYSNSEILHFIRDSGYPFEQHLDAGIWEFRITLQD